MDRFDYQSQLVELLDNALSELSSSEFQKLINRAKDIISDFE